MDGIVYVATGRPYIASALMSAASARRFYSGNILVLTDEARVKLWRRAKSKLDVDVKCIETDEEKKPQSSRVLKTKAMELSPFDRTLFLDADTFVLRPFDVLWNMVDGADPLGLTISQYHKTTKDVGADVKWKKVSVYQNDFKLLLSITGPNFPHWSSSTMVWRRCPRLVRLSRLWFIEWQRFKSRDMMALARSLFVQQLPVIHLPRKFNLRHRVEADTVIYTGRADKLRQVHDKHKSMRQLVKGILNG